MMPKYHLTRSDKEITEQTELEAIIKRGLYTTIAMCRNDEPYIVTMNYGYDQQKNALYFHAALEGLKLEFIEQNSAICATIIEDLGYQQGECNHHYRSLIIRGQMSIIEDLAEKKQALQIMIDDLEESPKEVEAKLLKNDDTYEKVTILRLDIEELSGKLGV
ncbi:MAG: pyridoxamine 5'-phosphate oxidase family protein [candidate division Zixibacteria bacterium]|nr:pyridoxamine 5'-phosphate oxidase family protein [candidate division Zixibacteria bacterium]